MDLGNAAQWGSFLLALAAFLNSLWVGLRNDHKDKIGKIETRLTNVETQTSKMASDLAHLPTADVAHRMEMAITRLEGRLETMDERLEGRLDAMDERLKPVGAMVARMQNYIFPDRPGK